MKNDLLQLIKKSATSTSATKAVEQIYELYEQIQYYKDQDNILKEFATWMNENYAVENLKINLFNAEIDHNRTIFHTGEDFNINDERVKTYVVEIDHKQNALVLMQANDEDHFAYLESIEETLQAMFFVNSPLIKDSILLEQLYDLTMKDNITGYYNRKYLDKYIKSRLYINNENNTKIAFMLVEVDRFKAVIEEFDYEIGDDVLIELAKIMNTIIKKEDIIIKLTGYEFLVILTDTDDEKAQEVSKEMIDRFSRAEVTVNMLTGQTLKKTICIGYSIYPEDAQDIYEAINQTDIALNEAKNVGRSQYLRFTKETESHIDLF